ncbi:MAG TPA: metallophosphoesterase, partial [Ilumatobacteraceae bacterium]|nr:metallophosphoesterase [Ilumatobacteraceae bacterium]
HRYDDLRPATTYAFGHAGGEIAVTTLSRPPGELLCRFATVNDVHFGEVEAGRLGKHQMGPIRRAEPGEAPYPETMNAGAVVEMTAIDPIAVFAKGDLTADGTPDQFAAFERVYRSAFGERLYAVRGNHDAYMFQTDYAGDRWVTVPGMAVALLDTTTPGATPGSIGAEQFEWLDTLAAESDVPVLVMGHHPQWLAHATEPHTRDGDTFSLDRPLSEALAEVCARRRSIVGYTAGHTHRHRNRPMLADGTMVTVEVGCVKDFPGTWAEYRVYEGGAMQVIHRISTADALSWSERCRHLYADFGIDYETYAMGHLEDRCFLIPYR